MNRRRSISCLYSFRFVVIVVRRASYIRLYYVISDAWSYISSIIVIILISTKQYLNNVRLEKNLKILVKYNICKQQRHHTILFLGIIHIPAFSLQKIIEIIGDVMNLIVIDDNADILLEFRIILKRDSEYKKVESRKKRRTTISSERTSREDAVTRMRILWSVLTKRSSNGPRRESWNAIIIYVEKVRGH